MQRKEGRWKEKVTIVGNILRLKTQDFFFLPILQTSRRTEPFFSYVKGVMLVSLIDHHDCVLSCDFCEIIRRAIP